MSAPPARRPPVLELAVLAADVEYDDAGQVENLVRPLHTVGLHANEEGGLPAPEFVLYVQMTDEEAHGPYPFRIEVRREETNTIIVPVLAEQAVTFASRYHPLSPFEHVFRLRGLVFPAPGWYAFHVMCRHVSMSDMPPQRPNAPPARAPRLRVVVEEPSEEQP